MIEAVRTTASPAVIWTIVVVMSFFTAFLVAATAVADSVQNRQSRRQRMMLTGMPDPAGLPSQRTSQEALTGQDRAGGADAAEAPTEPIPAPDGGAAARGRDSAPQQGPIPAQRGSESDRAERSFAGPSNPDPDEADQA